MEKKNGGKKILPKNAMKEMGRKSLEGVEITANPKALGVRKKLRWGPLRAGGTFLGGTPISKKQGKFHTKTSRIASQKKRGRAESIAGSHRMFNQELSPIRRWEAFAVETTGLG